MSAKELEKLTKTRLAKHAHEGWALAEKLRGQVRDLKRMVQKLINPAYTLEDFAKQCPTPNKEQWEKDREEAKELLAL